MAHVAKFRVILRFRGYPPITLRRLTGIHWMLPEASTLSKGMLRPANAGRQMPRLREEGLLTADYADVADESPTASCLSV